MEAGCYLDGCRGIYIHGAIIGLASEYGYQPSDEYLRAEEEADSSGEALEQSEDGLELLVWESDSATDWLNANKAEDGAYWGFSESGDFGLWADEDE